jgi:hypothetical protein
VELIRTPTLFLFLAVVVKVEQRLPKFACDAVANIEQSAQIRRCLQSHGQKPTRLAFVGMPREISRLYVEGLHIAFSDGIPQVSKESVFLIGLESEWP